MNEEFQNDINCLHGETKTLIQLCIEQNVNHDIVTRLNTMESLLSKYSSPLSESSLDDELFTLMLETIGNTSRYLLDKEEAIKIKHFDSDLNKTLTACVVGIDNGEITMFYPKNGGYQMRFIVDASVLSMTALKNIVNHINEELDVFELQGEYETKGKGRTKGYTYKGITAIGFVDGDNQESVEFWDGEERVITHEFDYLFPTKENYHSARLFLLEKKMEEIFQKTSK